MRFLQQESLLRPVACGDPGTMRCCNHVHRQPHSHRAVRGAEIDAEKNLPLILRTGGRARPWDCSPRSQAGKQPSSGFGVAHSTPDQHLSEADRIVQCRSLGRIEPGQPGVKDFDSPIFPCQKSRTSRSRSETLAKAIKELIDGYNSAWQ